MTLYLHSLSGDSTGAAGHGHSRERCGSRPYLDAAADAQVVGGVGRSPAPRARRWLARRIPMAEESAKQTYGQQDTDRQGRHYPELTPMELRELARQIVRLLKRDLAIERDRFGR